MRNEKWQGVFMLRANLDEMNIEAVDFGLEIRDGIQTRLDFPPVVFGAPMVQDLLDGLERDALRKVGDGLLVRQARNRKALLEIGQRTFGKLDPEGPNRGVACYRCGGFGHLSPPLVWRSSRFVDVRLYRAPINCMTWPSCQAHDLID